MFRADKLRHDLMDYYGTAKMENPAAIIDLIQVENADAQELISIAEGIEEFDLEDYVEECDYD